MRRPELPPDFRELLDQELASGSLPRVLEHSRSGLARGKYLHWDKVRYHTPPGGLSHRSWWLGLKLARNSLYRRVPLADVRGYPFQYVLAPPIPEYLHEIDLGAGGLIQMPEPITNPDTRNRYYVSSLIEEATRSSQLEGAPTTRKIASEMIRSGRKPADQGEYMILNNYRTMQRIGQLKKDRLSKDLLLELHRLITKGTLENPAAEGRFRTPDERRVVGDPYGDVFHEPPDAERLEDRLRAMCDFGNGTTPKHFVHPVIRSIMLHFWLAYDHPFVDGNGRTARALFYWSMLRHGYWLCEFLSISSIIIKAPAQYYRAFLYTETDDNDLTYFLTYHVKVLRRAVRELHEYIQRKTQQLEALETFVRASAELNHRQRALLSHALRHPTYRYTIESHSTSHKVVPQTARMDLHDLCQRGLLIGTKIKKRWYFAPAPDLEAKLRNPL